MKIFDGWMSRTNPFVAISSALLAALFVGLILVSPEFVTSLQGTPQQFIARHLTGYLFWMVTVYMLFTIGVALTPYGRITLSTCGIVYWIPCMSLLAPQRACLRYRLLVAG